MYCFLVGDSTTTVYLQYCPVFAWVQTGEGENERLPFECDFNLTASVRRFVHVLFPPPTEPPHLLLLLCVPCVTLVMSADCRLLWCLCLLCIWPTLGIWPGLIVLMVTPASRPQVGAGAQQWSRHNEGDVIKQSHTQKVKCQEESCFCVLPPRLRALLMKITQLRLLMLRLCFFVNILRWVDRKEIWGVFLPWQQRWLCNNGINIKLSLYIVLVLYILRGETGTSTYNITLINGNKKKVASVWRRAVQEILFLFVHFVLSPCFVICFGVLISAKSIIFFVVWNCVSGTKKGLLLLLKVPVCDFSLSLWLPDKVIIRRCFLPAITFSYNGSNTRKAKGVERRQG